MSSHHFVKEGQEPALLILDALTFDVAAPLLEWAPLVVVAHRAIDSVLLWNIKIDVVLAEEKDVKDLSSKLAAQTPVTILAHSTNESPLTNALHFLIRRKQNGVNILSANPVETFVLVEELADQIQINAIDGSVRWSAIASGRFEKWMAAGTILFLRDNETQQTIDLHNLKKVDHYYHCIADGMVRLESKSLFWLGEREF